MYLGIDLPDKRKENDPQAELPLTKPSQMRPR
jgi:hypothetical protein